MNDFEKYTKDTLKDYPSPVDETRLWGNIEQVLREDKRRPAALWLWLSCLGLLVSGGLAWYYFFEKNTTLAGAQPVKEIGAVNMTGQEKTAFDSSTAHPASPGGRADSKQINYNRTDRAATDFIPPDGSKPSDRVKEGPLNTPSDSRGGRVLGGLKATRVSTPPPTPPLKGKGGVADTAAYATEVVASPLPFRGGAGGGVDAQAATRSPISNTPGLNPSDEESTTITNPSAGALPAPVFLPTLLQELSAADKPDISSNTKTGCSTWSKGPAFKPYFGVYGGAQYPVKTLQAKETEFENIVADRQETETILEGIAAGAYFGVKHRSGVFAEGGLEYNRINERFDRTTLRTDTIGKIAVIGIIVNAPGDTTFISDSIHILQETRTMKRTYNNYRFLQVPLALGYTWQPNNRWSLYGKAGVAVNLRFQQKAEIVNLTGLPEKYVSEKVGPGYPFRSKISLSLFVNAGARYRLTDHLSIFGELRYLHQGSEITADDYPVRQQYKLPGMNVGAHFQF